MYFSEVSPAQIHGCHHGCLGHGDRYVAQFLTSQLVFHASTGAFAQVVGYSLEAPAPPFPVLALGYAITGFGLSLQACELFGALEPSH